MLIDVGYNSANVYQRSGGRPVCHKGREESCLQRLNVGSKSEGKTIKEVISEVVFEKKKFRLKDGREVLLRSPSENDAEDMLQFIIKASGETDFLMKFPEEYAELTLDQEKAFIHEAYDNKNRMMIACFVDGRFAGNCMISFNTGKKDRHRASVAIALLQEFWNLGIGTRMFEELFQAAKERGDVVQIELDFIKGNTRARRLYEKMGFRITGVKPDAIRMKDGSFVNEYMMVKKL